MPFDDFASRRHSPSVWCSAWLEIEPRLGIIFYGVDLSSLLFVKRIRYNHRGWTYDTK